MSLLLPRDSRRHGRQDGQSLVEFALVLPIFLLLVFAIFDVGRVVWASDSLANAAREAARYAIVHGKDSGSIATKSDIRGVAQGYSIAGGTGITVTVCYGSGCSGDTDVSGAVNQRGTPVTVAVTSSVPMLTGSLLGMGPFGVSGSSTMLVNR
jgi:Flp pilus assembly protein TadG